MAEKSSEVGFTITPKAVPKRKGRGASDFYPRIIEEFIAADIDEGVIEGTGKKPATLVLGLSKAAKSVDAPVKVRRVEDEVFLIRIK